MAPAADRFTVHMPEVAKLLLGKPNPSLSTKAELRFGSNGSVSVDLTKGTFFDHSASEGGGVLGLIERETGLGGSEAIGWMEEHGLSVEGDHFRAEVSRRAPTAQATDDAQAAMRAARRRPPSAVYDYVDECGHLLFQACRFEWEHGGQRHKTFSQRRRARDGDEPEKVRDGWIWSIKGERIVPYRLPELIGDIQAGRAITIVEGEKDVDNLRSLDIPASCNPMGAGKWWDALTECFAGADVVILPDNDDPGRKHADGVAAKLHGVAECVRLLELPGLPPKGDATDWIDAGGTREAFFDLVERQSKPWKPSAPTRESRFGRVSFGELRHRKAKSPDFVVDDWMVAREVSFFAGESEAGKTFLAIDVAMRTALGWPVFGRRTKPGLVIYQIGESGDSLLDLRIPAWVHQFGANLPERVPFEILPAKINLWTADEKAKDGVWQFLDAIRGIWREYPDLPLSAVYIDTFSKASAGANEIDGKDVGRIISNAELIARETGAHVTIIHHFPKGGHTLRGHGSLRADVNAVAMVEVDRQTKIRTITLDKLKDGVKADMQFELKQVLLGHRDDGKPITCCVVLPVGEKAKEREAAAESASVNANEKVLLEALFKALDTHGIPAPAGLELPSHAKVVDYAEVRRIFGETSPIDDLEQHDTDEAREEARRKHRNQLKTRLKRAREFMTTSTKIIRVASCEHPETGKSTDFAWWTGRPVRGFPQTQPRKPKEPETPAVIAEEGTDWIKDIF